MKWSPLETLLVGALILLATVVFVIVYGVFTSQIYMTPAK